MEISRGDLVAISHTPSYHSLGQITEKNTSSNEKKRTSYKDVTVNKCFSKYIHVYSTTFLYYKTNNAAGQCYYYTQNTDRYVAINISWVHVHTDLSPPL